MIPTTVLNLLKIHWKTVLFFVLPIIAFVAGALVYSQPDRVVTVEKEVFKEKIIYVDRIVDTDKTKTDTKVNKHVEKTVVVSPDGTRTEKTVTDSQAVKTIYVDRVVERVVNRTEFVDRVIDKSVTIDNQKRFRVGLLVGAHPDLIPVPKINSWAVGGEVDVRIVGPFSAGIWILATAQGQGLGGLKLGLEF